MSDKTNLPTTEELSENGSKYATILKLHHGGKKVCAYIVMDFKLYRRAMNMAIAPSMEAQKGQNAQVNVQMDLIGAGDEILFQGIKKQYSDTVILEQISLRTKAGQMLGEWLLSLMDDSSNSGEKKE